MKGALVSAHRPPICWNALWKVSPLFKTAEMGDFHLSDTMRSETSPTPCSQKYAVKCVLSLICSLWHLTNLMVPQPTVRMVQGWICLPMESGVVGFRRPYLTWEYLTPSPPLIETRHQGQCTGSMNLRKSGLTSSGYKRWNTPPSVLLFFQPQDV